MLSTDLGACEWFVWDLRRSNLIDRGQLDQVIGDFLGRHPGAEPPALADFLVQHGTLTRFQADRLLQGKTQGFVLGPYTLMDALGTGSMGTVYKARSKNDDAWYAVKVLPRRSMWNVRIARRKVRAFEQARHPAVVPFLDVGTSGGMHYLAWPLVEGESLDQLVARQGPLAAGLAAGYTVQAAEGLEVCHKQGLFHGLLKPSNLMLGPDGQVRILDLGIGSLLAETEGESLVDTMSTANSVSNGLDCASPESIMDPTNLTPAGDQYSLGCVLYFLVSGRYPFPDGTAVEKMMAHQTKQPPPLRSLNPAVAEELAAVVERLMQKAPEARYPGTAEVIAALRPFVAPQALAPKPAAKPVREVRPERPAAAPPPPPPVRAAHDTPPPGARGAGGASARATMLAVPRGAQPTRATLPAPNGPAEPPAGTAPAAPASAAPASAAEKPAKAGRSWDERLGTVGIAICALVACALAWWLAHSYHLF
jgi:serine/threonine protein kinase